jgi:hypothetical protein
MAKREPRSSTKYKNIVGSAFPNFVKEQISARKKLVGKKTRNTNETLWLTNRVGWTRLSSGAKTKPDGLDIPDNIRQDILSNVNARGESFLETNSFPSEAARVGTGGLQASKAARELAEAEDALYTTDLAKANVLQGGTVSISETKDIDGKVKFQANRKTQFNELYKQGATDQLGLKPMPGVTSISVGTGGKWQTLLQGDVEFICYDLDQLEIMSKLYMSLGVHVFLEWGHSPYIDKDGNLLKSNEPIDYFNINSTQDLLQKVTKKKEQTGGNYGALVGRVYNFDFVANNDGSYNCKIQIMGPGGMLESLRINKSSRIDYDIISKENEGSKYSSDLANALHTIRETLKNSGIAQNVKSQTYGYDTTTTTKFGVIDGSNFFQKISDISTERTTSYAETLNNIFGSCNYKGPSFYIAKKSAGGTNGNVTIDYKSDFTKFGNAWQIISDLSNTPPSQNPNDNLNPLPLSTFFGFSAVHRVGGAGTQVSTQTKGEFTTEYITFGHLMCLIQHVSVFVYGKDRNESTRYNPAQRRSLEAAERRLGPNPNSSFQSGNTYNPIIYLDYHPDNTKVLTGPLEASFDPSICLVPLNINLNKDVNGDSDYKAFGRFFKPLDTMENSTKAPKWDSERDKTNLQKNLIHLKNSNVINNALKSTNPPFPSKYDGKLFNVLINLTFAIDQLEKLANGGKDVNLIEYINALLDGINVSLGKVNNFRAFFDDCSSVVRVIDENLTEEITEDSLLEIPNYGLQSVAYDYSYSSKISPKLASQIIIASQAADKGGISNFTEDVLTYNKLNGNVRDRFSELIIPPLEISKEDSDLIEQKKATQKLYNDLHNIYTLDQITDGTSNYINLYADLQNINRKYYSTKNTNLVIPLVFSIEIDGIDGILPYNAFKIPDDRLPKRYRGKVAFAVFNINHNFNSNNWTTTLNGQTILINPTYIIDDRKNSEGENIPPPILVDRPVTEDLANVTYGGKLDLLYTKPNLNQPGSKGTKLPTDATSTTSTTTTGEETQSTSPFQLDPRPASIPTDIQTAIPFIKTQESETGAQIKAYKDPDYTVAAGYKWRIGWGSDTITTPGGSTRAVKEGDVITQSQADADLERRLKTEFKPKVVSTCRANGVDYDSLPSNVKTVFIDCAYNYGSLWNDIVISYRDGGNTIPEKTQGLIQELQRRIDRGASQVPKRRGAEIEHLGGTPRYNN